MTITLDDMLLYAGALILLTVTPGPVVVAVVARTLSGGIRAALPLALAVMLGDMAWALLALFGASALVALYGDVLIVLRWFGAAMFAWMGWQLIRGAGMALKAPEDMQKGTARQAFAAGLLAILGNPKAILFYMGVIPSFFPIARLTWADIGVIVAMSAALPFLGNLFWAGFAHRVRGFLRTPRAVARVNTGAGIALIAVGIALIVL